jgi:hypothetical protein
MQKIVRTLFVGGALAVPRAALACAVCFGASDAPMAKATNMGIFMMLGVVVGMLACFAAFFVHLNRRARLAEQAGARTWKAGAADAGLFASDPQEGTAQC